MNQNVSCKYIFEWLQCLLNGCSDVNEESKMCGIKHYYEKRGRLDSV